MKTTELRIGNWVTTTGKSEKVRGVLDNLVFFDDDTSCGIGYVFGLPLTEDWLVRMGFEKLNHALMIDDGSRSSYGDKILGKDTFYLFDRSYGKMAELTYFGHNRQAVKYVHQLQNLYHALSGQELTIK